MGIPQFRPWNFGLAPCGIRPPPPPACPFSPARCRDCSGCQALRNSVTAGLSSASFCRIASAVRNSASASDGLPIRDSSQPRLLWLPARSLRNSVTAGLSSTSFCWIASALRNSASASVGLPVPTAGRQCAGPCPPGRGGRRSRPRGRRPAPPGRPAPAGRPPARRRFLPVLERSQPSRDRQSASAARAAGSDPPGRPAATPTAGRPPAPRPSCPSLRAARRRRSGSGRRRPWPRRRPPAPPPAPREPPAPPGAPPGRPPCGRPCPSARPARSWTAPGPAARRCRSPCRAGRRACRRSPRPISRAGRAAP